jgi:SAM-dependent methyltransferase
VSFQVSADAYGRFMGRYSEPLAVQFAALAEPADQAGAGPGRRALDVGCGPGALTAELVDRFGPAAVCAVDPSEPFVQAARARFPAVDVRQASAEALPFGDGEFDLTLAQLVVHFMADPVAGIAEMARVTRPGGVVGACVWDFAGERGPLSVFWRAVRDLDAAADDESGRAGARAGHLVELFGRAGLADPRPDVLTVRVAYASVAEWWQPYTLGVGPAGAYVAGLDPARREALLRRCAELLPDGPFEVSAAAWVALAVRS